MYTVKLEMPQLISIASKHLKAFAVTECYMLGDWLYVHFDTEEDMIAWKLTWNNEKIIDAVNDSVERTWNSEAGRKLLGDNTLHASLMKILKVHY